MKLTPAKGKNINIAAQKKFILKISPKIYYEGKSYIVFRVQAACRLQKDWKTRKLTIKSRTLHGMLAQRISSHALLVLIHILTEYLSNRKYFIPCNREALEKFILNLVAILRSVLMRLYL